MGCRGANILITWIVGIHEIKYEIFPHIPVVTPEYILCVVSLKSIACPTWP